MTICRHDKFRTPIRTSSNQAPEYTRRAAEPAPTMYTGVTVVDALGNEGSLYFARPTYPMGQHVPLQSVLPGP